MIQEILKKKGVDISKVYLAYCPERVLPGRIMTELVENARVIGGIEPGLQQRLPVFIELL